MTQGKIEQHGDECWGNFAEIPRVLLGIEFAGMSVRELQFPRELSNLIWEKDKPTRWGRNFSSGLQKPWSLMKLP